MFGLKVGVVELLEHKPIWEEEAHQMIKDLRLILGGIALDIQHIGSTAIPNIVAKPIIDLAMKVENFDELMKHLPAIESLGFKYIADADLPNALYFNRRINDNTLTTHHLHVFNANSIEWVQHLYFRDYLIENPDVAQAYQNLKLKLMSQYKHDRLMYTQSKADFIQHILKNANKKPL